MNAEPDPSQTPPDQQGQPQGAAPTPVPYLDPTPTPTADWGPDASSSQTASGDVPTQDSGAATPAMFEFGDPVELSASDWRNSGVQKLIRREIRMLRDTLLKKEKIEENYNEARVSNGRLEEQLDAEIRVNVAVTRGQNVAEISLSLFFLVAGVLGSDGYSAKYLSTAIGFYLFAIAIAAIGVVIKFYAAGLLKTRRETK